ncbi:hypothetical protein AVEN_110681-1 [Araneus ventricosus]|uniref:Uncharacterized protein n=1 Tax=Araneus ventricosus TaxID=182803 RepID=A0A4Y2ATM0_ARAVE|nr:hypothetical protein AVEN_110681-1 [Araneus ventricosus]
MREKRVQSFISFKPILPFPVKQNRFLAYEHRRNPSINIVGPLYAFLTSKYSIIFHRVPRIHLVDYGTIRSQSSSLVSTVLGLRFHVQQHHLRQGELRLRCESTLAREILRRREEVIFEGRHETADLQVAQIAKSVSSDSMKCASSICMLLSLLLILHSLYRMSPVINDT